jgi:hypothetical protein
MQLSAMTQSFLFYVMQGSVSYYTLQITLRVYDNDLISVCLYETLFRLYCLVKCTYVLLSTYHLSFLSDFVTVLGP